MYGDEYSFACQHFISVIAHELGPREVFIISLRIRDGQAGCELSEKSKGGQNKGSSPPLSSPPSPLSLQPPPRRVRCAISKGVGAYSRGFNPLTPRQLAHWF
jgi:hypothetical protein